MRKRIEEEEMAALATDSDDDEVNEEAIRMEIRNMLRLKKMQQKRVQHGSTCAPTHDTTRESSTQSSSWAHRGPMISETKAAIRDDEYHMRENKRTMAMYDELQDLQRKILRMEAEQRVQRCTLREGDLEVARFDLRRLQRLLQLD
ncbi:hypothetical protein AB1Y20_009327 [Prymnesium parvum]|uniref:Uncharacterized protein n=1 Tax=Prymnesium parvum TaxID=97485 RepID=A0AB34K4R7_PRYPA